MAASAPSPAVTKHDLETRLIEKCWKDPEFRKQVIADPKGTLERYFGRPLPRDLKIVIHEDDAKTTHFALPPTPSSITELSDEELEKVAGGTELAVAVTVSVGLLVTIVGAAEGAKSGW